MYIQFIARRERHWTNSCSHHRQILVINKQEKVTDSLLHWKEWFGTNSKCALDTVSGFITGH